MLADVMAANVIEAEVIRVVLGAVANVVAENSANQEGFLEVRGVEFVLSSMRTAGMLG